MANELTQKVNVMDAVHWISMAWNEVTSYTIQKCFKKVGFTCENEQSRIEDSEATAVNNLESILQEFHSEIEPETYLDANGDFLVCNNIIEEKEDSIDEDAEPGETDETRSTITFKEYGQGIQDLLNCADEHHPEAYPLLKK